MRRFAVFAFVAILWAGSAFGYSGSVGVWAMKSGDFVARNFAGDSSGVVAALAYCSGGGIVQVGPGDITFSSRITIPEGVKLQLGQGTYTFTGTSGILVGDKATLEGQGYGSTILSASSTFSAPFMVSNTDTTGSQENVRLLAFQINGNSSSGARVDAGIKLKKIFVMTQMQDILVNTCSGVGIRVDGGPAGPVFMRNIWINNGSDDGLLFDGDTSGQVGAPFIYGITIERWGTGKAAIRFRGSSSGNACFSGVVVGGYFESSTDATSEGVVIRNWSNLTVENITFNGGTMNYPVKIEGGATSAVFGSYGVTVRNIYSVNDTILFDQVNNIGKLASGGYHLWEYQTPPDQYEPLEKALISNSTLTLTPGYTVYTMSGTTTVTDITGDDWFLYRPVTFIVSTALQFSVTAPVRVNGNFIGNGTGNQDILIMMWDGNVWNEIGRVLDTGGASWSLGSKAATAPGYLVAVDSLRTNKGLYVGGQFVNKILRASATLDYDLSALTTQDLTITVTGAALNDEVFVGSPNGSITTTVQYTGWVSAANTVTVRARTLAVGENPASGTFKVTVFQ